MNLENYTEHKSCRKRESDQGVKDSREFLEMIQTRRSIREFSDKKVPAEIIENALRAAVSAPSGANKQPWLFAVVEDKGIKQKIREAAEAEEELFYTRRASEEWLRDLMPLGTDQHKPYLEHASHLIVVCAKFKEEIEANKCRKTYYPVESTGLAAGMLITALHNAGVGTLTHTPSPMKFLNRVLGLDSYYRPMMIIVAGYPKEKVLVPKIEKKPLEEMVKFY